MSQGDNVEAQNQGAKVSELNYIAVSIIKYIQSESSNGKKFAPGSTSDWGARGPSAAIP